MSEERGYEPHLLESAVQEFQRQWIAAIDQVEQLTIVFERLLESQKRLAEHGTRTAVEMPTQLGQTWWVAFRRKAGDRPKEGMPLMKHEDEIAMERLELVQDAVFAEYERAEG